MPRNPTSSGSSSRWPIVNIIANRLELDLQSTSGLPTTIDGHDASVLIDGLQLRYRRHQLEKIRATIENEYTTEEHIQAALRDSY